MNLHRVWLRALLGLLMMSLTLLTACGPAAVAQEEPETTPTPLPPAPVLERPTYTVERGTIEDTLEINGRVTPVDLVRLSFKREGRVETVGVKRGDVVQEGQVLAQLQQEEALDKLRRAENALTQAQRALADAEKERGKSIRRAELELENAQKALTRVLPGGPDDPIRTAQKELETAQRDADKNKVGASEAKTEAENQLLIATRELSKTQEAYSDAFWDYDWVKRYGTDPAEAAQIRETEPVSGTEKPEARKLTDREKDAFQDKLVEAEQALRDAERKIETTQREIDKKRTEEIDAVGVEDEKVQEARRKLDELITGEGNQDLIDRRSAVEQAQLGVEEAREGSLDSQLTAVEDAQVELEQARKEVQDGQIIAPQNGELIALAIGEGDEITAFESVIEIADPTNLEIAAQLSAEQMRSLAEGQPATISLLSRPDVLMPSVIRLMPAPYGSGGSGAVQEEDQTTRFQIEDTKGQELTSGTVAKVQIVLESKENVLLLPPDAIRTFEGRRFVVVRDGDRDRRVPVETGIETEEVVEIIEDPSATDGLKEGDVVVGQ
jgi:multidrug efflux pump subunit AcrA (membrane-fusion protein)